MTVKLGAWYNCHSLYGSCIRGHLGLLCPFSVLSRVFALFLGVSSFFLAIDDDANIHRVFHFLKRRILFSRYGGINITLTHRNNMSLFVVQRWWILVITIYPIISFLSIEVVSVLGVVCAHFFSIYKLLCEYLVKK